MTPRPFLSFDRGSKGGAPRMPSVMSDMRVVRIIAGRAVGLPVCYQEVREQTVVDGRAWNPAELIYRLVSKALP